MLKIYHMPGSRSQRVVWAAEELGLPYQAVIMHRADLKLPDFLAINPLGGAPAIEDGAVKMHESCAIVQYLVDRYDRDQRISPPNDSPERAAFLQWMHFAEASLWPRASAFVSASGLTGSPPNEPAMAAARLGLANITNYIDNTLAARDYIAGDRFTAADIAIYYSLRICALIKAVDDSETKNILAYAARLIERPALRKALEMPADWVNQPPGSVSTPPIVRLS